jgi:uncharacterized oligopeptide transporter (OPT) family protein
MIYLAKDRNYYITKHSKYRQHGKNWSSPERNYTQGHELSLLGLCALVGLLAANAFVAGGVIIWNPMAPSFNICMSKPHGIEVLSVTRFLGRRSQECHIRTIL